MQAVPSHPSVFQVFHLVATHGVCATFQAVGFAVDVDTLKLCTAGYMQIITGIKALGLLIVLAYVRGFD